MKTTLSSLVSAGFASETPFSTVATAFWGAAAPASAAVTITGADAGVAAARKVASIRQKAVSWAQAVAAAWQTAVSWVGRVAPRAPTGLARRTFALRIQQRRARSDTPYHLDHERRARSDAPYQMPFVMAMAELEPLRWDTPGVFWDDGHTWDQLVPVPSPDLQPIQNINLNNTSGMEYWEITKNRAQITRPIWQQYTPALKVNKLGYADLDTLIGQFEPLVQLRTTAQDDFDESDRAVQRSLLIMKVLGTKVPAIIEGLLDESPGIMKDVNDLYGTTPRTEASILKRARELYPVWSRANTALAALTPTQAPIQRVLAGTAYTAVLLKGLLDGYTDVVKTMRDKEELLNEKRLALRGLDRTTDQLGKRWYKVAKASAETDSDLETALENVPTEQATPAPDTIEINTVTQGGDGGLQVLVSYVPGGGDHATTKLIKWQVVGVDADFVHSAPLDASGNALGPFAQGTTVKVKTEVSNSIDTRTTAARTITLGPPIV